MKLIEILQWLGGAGGVALLTVLFNQINNKKSSEHDLIDKMSSQMTKSNERIDILSSRIDKLEQDNVNLRNDNIKISYAKTQIVAEKNRMEQELVDKIDKLTKENRTLKKKIRELEAQRQES